jgi:hypothetical protein
MSPYPANLCPLSGGVEFAGFGEDLGQAIGELVEAMSGRPSGSSLICPRAPGAAAG